MLFEKHFKPEVNPERLYALLKLTNSGHYNETELRNILIPPDMNNDQNEFSPVYKAALDTSLIKKNEFTDVIECKVPSETLNNPINFRRYMSNLSSRESNLFTRFTSWYISQNMNVFYYSSAEELSVQLPKEFIDIDKKSIRGWRFWASFLGFGYLHNTFLIPNMSIRISDVFNSERPFATNEIISFTSFMGYLNHNCQVTKNSFTDKDLNLAISNGLRSLHDKGRIEIIYTPDSDDVWHLSKSESHLISENVTEVIIKERFYE